MKLKDVLKRACDISKKEDEDALFWLLLETFNITRSMYYLDSNLDVESDLVLKYEELVHRYLNEKIPVQYLIGYTYFYGNKIYVNEDTLIPRPETEELVDKTIKYIKDKFKDLKNLNILDLATGSGCIGIAIKKELDCNVIIADFSKEALDVAKKNVLNNNLDINIVWSDWFDKIDLKFDVIISNPPYIPSDYKVDEIVSKEPYNALYSGSEGLDSYNDILSSVSDYLNKEGIIAFEHGYDQKDKIKALVLKYLKDVKIIQEQDLSGKDRYTFIFK